jgi:hypothetical protein
MVESKMLEFDVATTTLTNGAVTVTDEFVICPTQRLVQLDVTAATPGTADASFTGTKIWLKGIHLSFFASNGSTSAAMKIKLAVFKTFGVDWSALNWGVRTELTGKAPLTHFYDRTYGAASSNTHPQKYLAPINTRGGGPDCIFFKEYNVPQSSSALVQGNFTKIDMYLPLNKIETFHEELSENDLTTSPNYLQHGDYVYVIKYINSSDQVSTDNLIIWGTKFRMHFKDP